MALCRRSLYSCYNTSVQYGMSQKRQGYFSTSFSTLSKCCGNISITLRLDAYLRQGKINEQRSEFRDIYIGAGTLVVSGICAHASYWTKTIGRTPSQKYWSPYSVAGSISVFPLLDKPSSSSTRDSSYLPQFSDPLAKKKSPFRISVGPSNISNLILARSYAFNMWLLQ